MNVGVISLCIADDEAVIRNGLASLSWEEHGIELFGVVEDGAKAAEIIQSEMIDVLLADIRMPNMDGLALARLVVEENISTGVVLLSGYGEFQLAQAAIANRVSSYLLKPTDPEEIIGAVLRAGSEVVEHRDKDLRLSLLEAELGRNQLAMDDRRFILGEVSHQGVESRIVKFILMNFRENINLSSASAKLGYSSIYLSRVIKKYTGFTFVELVNALRVQEAARMLRESSEPFWRIADSVGSLDPGYFGQLFKKSYGCTPSAYRKEPRLPTHSEIAITVSSLKQRFMNSGVR